MYSININYRHRDSASWGVRGLQPLMKSLLKGEKSAHTFFPQGHYFASFNINALNSRDELQKNWRAEEENYLITDVI